MKYCVLIFIIALFANTLIVHAQCSNDSLMAIKGKWVKNTGSNSNKAKSPETIKRMDQMLQLLQSAYIPKGTEGKYWYNEQTDRSLRKNIPLTYDLTADFMEYYCNSFQKNNNLKLGNETGDWFFIWANTFGRFAMEDMDFMIENKQVYQLTPQLGELNGFPLFAGADGNELQGSNQFSRTILISRQGQLPYTTVTRKQYLLAFLKYREDSYQKDIAYAQSQHNSISFWETAYQKDIQPAKEYLANQPEQELAKPALLKPGNHKNDFKNFENEDKGRMLIVVNESYFNSKPAAYVPQFVAVYWKWGGSTPGRNCGTMIEKNFDFKALQQMLDK